MADKLEWLDKHFVLLKYNNVSDMVANEGYKVSPNVEQFLPDNDLVEKFLDNLVKNGLYKDACHVLAYAIHRRAGVWWGYRSIMALLDETGGEPFEARDIADIGKPGEPELPDFLKDLPQIKDFDKKVTKEDIDKQLSKLGDLEEKMKGLLPPHVKDTFNAYFDEAMSMFKKQHGYTPMELMQMAVDKFKNTPKVDYENSPIFKAEKELKEKIETMRQETIDVIKSVVPTKPKEYVIKMQKKALDCVYAWVVSPDEENSKIALDVGNECPDTPAGLLCLTAFWSYGNLTPMTNQVVKTPAGLAANGLNSAILNMSLAQGGTKKPKERFEEYFNIGLNVAYGKDNWADSLEKDISPHQEAPARTTTFASATTNPTPTFGATPTTPTTPAAGTTPTTTPTPTPTAGVTPTISRPKRFSGDDI